MEVQYSACSMATPPRPLLELKVLILLTTVFINSFVVYTRVLSYNEGHEASL